MKNRLYKGNSLIDFPTDYIVIDTETTGLDPNFNSIIEISAIRYHDGDLVDSFSELMKPDNYYILDEEDFEYFSEEDYVNVDGKYISFVDSFITSLTGITNSMLATARTTKEVMSQFVDFIKDDVLIGHNVNFDINFIYDTLMRNFDKPLTNDFIDTMRISRKLLKNELSHHRLIDLCDYYNIKNDNAHRSYSDSLATQSAFEHLKETIIETYGTYEDFIKLYKHSGGNHFSAKDIIATSDDYDETHPLFNQLCVFTGTLNRFTRKEAMQIVVNCGGKVGDNITKKTNYLILGNNEYNPILKGEKSNKQKKAEGMLLKGEDISIISEDVFYDLIEDYNTTIE